MKVIFETPVKAIDFRDSRDGKAYRGNATFRVILYERDEEPEAVPDAERANARVRSLAQWRAQYGRKLLVPPGPAFNHAFTAIAIPDAVVAGLADDARLELRWRFVPGMNWWPKE